CVCVLVVCVLTALSLQQTPQKQPADAVEAAQKPSPVPGSPPAEQKTEHERASIFRLEAVPSSSVFHTQPKGGRITGFDFYRDPLNADQPLVKFEDIMKKESANRAAVMKAQRALLESRFNLVPKLDPEAKMSRGKPLSVGPTAK